MKYWSLAVLVLFIGGLIVPVAGAEPGRYSYITVESVTVDLVNDRATIDMTYEIDEGVQLLVVLLGKSDLKTKLTSILNFDNPQFRVIELDHAVVVVDDMVFNYGDGSYWFPEHEFRAVIPELTIRTPQSVRYHTFTEIFPNGIGYFETA
ncbi:MAG: hypothetical protein APR53_09340 [Methanoculleus sp. SDB]|nr:MAG: hypothetical protein APR53_09340 [Methanoculleus sp. SDB]